LDAVISGATGQTGAGMDLSAISWVSIVVDFDNANDLLPGIITGGWIIKRVLDIYQVATVSYDVNTPNFNLTKIANKPVSTNTGNAGTGTQRVVLASDQPVVEVDATDLDIRNLVSATDDVSVTTVKPDGTYTMPSMDVSARKSFVKITDGTDDVNLVYDGLAYTSDIKHLPVMGMIKETSAVYMPLICDENSFGLLTQHIDTSGNKTPAGDADARAISVDLGTNNDVTVTSDMTPSDDYATPTTAVRTGSFGMFYDGTNWDMMRGTSANGLLVNLGVNNDVSVSSGTIDTITTLTGITNDVTVDASNLDIRDLTNASDNVLIYGYDYTSTNYPMQITSLGLIEVDEVQNLAGISAGDTTIGGVMSVGGDGAKSDTSLTLTSATTAYSNTAPATPHLLVVHNASDTDVYFRFTTGTTLGTLLSTKKSLSIDMGASEVLYFYCGSAGKVINYSTRANF